MLAPWQESGIKKEYNITGMQPRRFNISPNDLPDPTAPEPIPSLRGNFTKECPECQSRDIKHDFAKGEVCCNACGFVIREDFYQQDFTTRPAPTVNITLEAKEVFNNVYRNLPRVLNDMKEEDEAIYKGLSQQGLTHYGSKKGTTDSIIKGLVLNRCLWDVVFDSKSEGKFHLCLPKNISFLDIPDFLSVDEVRKGFEGIEIVVRNLCKRYNATPPKNVFPDSFIFLIFDKERWLQSYDLSWWVKEMYPKEYWQEVKWRLIKVLRRNIRIIGELPFVVKCIMEMKKGEGPRSFSYMLILSELNLLWHLEKEIIKERFENGITAEFDSLPIELKKSRKVLWKIWGIPHTRAHQKWRDIDSVF